MISSSDGLPIVLGGIDSVEVFVLKIPLVESFVTGYGTEVSKEVLLIKISSDGVSGWGECVSFKEPFYHYETVDISLSVLERYLIPILFENPTVSIDEMYYRFGRVKGSHMAKAMVENAILDLYCKQNRIPLYEVLGGRKKKIKSGISFGITPDIDQLIGKIDMAVKKKYHRIKVKIKRGWDVKVVSDIRKVFPNINLSVDANGGYSEKDLKIFRDLEKFNLKMIEQPFEDENFPAHARLQEQIDTSVCLDESITGIQSVRCAIDSGSCRIVCIKQGRVGGMIRAKEINEYCRNNNIGMWSGGMIETGIGRAFNLHLQTLNGFESPGDTSESSRFFKEDIVGNPVVLDSDGLIDIPGNVGIGVEVLPGMIEKFSIFNKRMR